MKTPQTKAGKFLHWLGIRQLFNNKETLKDKIQSIIVIVERIKQAVDSDAAVAITAIIPGSWDDVAVEKFRVILTSVLLKLRLTESNNETSVNRSVKKLAGYAPEMRNKQYKKIAVNMLLLDGAVVSEQAANILVENEYQLFKSKSL